MKLYIRIKDGQPFEHPIFEDNFLQAFPNIDVNNLPSEFACFERITPPELTAYQVYEGVTYEKIGNIYTDVHHVREMTEQEKNQKQEETKAAWNNHFPSWIFDEISCSFIAPIEYPTDNKVYKWDETTISWIEVA